jgi:hypothetical protein
MHKIKRSKPHWLTYKKLKVAHETMRRHILCSGKIRKKNTPLIQRQYGLKTWITLNIYLGTFNPADRFRKINFPFGGLWHGPCQGSPLAQPLDTCPTFTPEHTRQNHIKPSLRKSVENWFFLPPPKYYMFQSKYLHHHLIHSCHGWFQPKDQSGGILT